MAGRPARGGRHDGAGLLERLGPGAGRRRTESASGAGRTGARRGTRRGRRAAAVSWGWTRRTHAVFALDLEGGGDPAEGLLQRARAVRRTCATSRRSCRRTTVAWRRARRRCSSGGGVTASAPPAASPLMWPRRGWKRLCPACKVEHFPRTDPVVIMLPVRDGAMPARPPALLGAGPILGSGWLHGAGRVDRGGLRARDQRGVWAEDGGCPLPFQPALALSKQLDDRPNRRGRAWRGPRRPDGTGGGALASARGGGGAARGAAATSLCRRRWP